MDINLEKYTENLLKGYCEKKPATKNKFLKTINIVKQYSTNILENHDPESIKQCKIRDSDPLINMTNPISKTREDYENILGNIIEAECKLIDNDSSHTLTPSLLKLINFCNTRILEFNKNPIDSVENCNFKIKVYNKGRDILFGKSAMHSLYLTLRGFLREIIPIRICRSIGDLQELYNTVIHVVSESDSSYIECKLSEYMFQSNEGNRICLTNNREQILLVSKFILDVYDQFCVDDPSKPYLEDLKMYIDKTLQNNTYNAIEPLQSSNYYYLSNSGDGDCLFIAVVKYLSILSNAERQYPNNSTLKKIAKELRFETCKYMFQHRYDVVNDIGTIENNTESTFWLLNSNGGETNNDKFNSLMRSLSIKRNISIFKNPTHFTLEELIDLYKRSDIDDFTKYCILMAQYSMGSEHFLLKDSTKLYLSYYGGICEIICMGLLLNKNIICSSTTLKEGNPDFKYNIGTKFSYVDKYNPDDNIELPILIYLRGYKTKKRGSKSDHFEMLWPKSMGKPTGINSPRELTKSQQPLFGYNTTHAEKLVPNYDTTDNFSLELAVYSIDTFISGSIPNDYVETMPPIILKYWNDISKKLSSNLDTVEHSNFGHLDKEVFVADDKIRVGKFVYRLEYLTRFTNIMEKGFATKSEIEEIIEIIDKTNHIDTKKPIEINLSDADDEGNIKPIYANFKQAPVLKKLLITGDISKYIKVKKTIGDESAVEEEEEEEEKDSKRSINLDSDKWVIFGNYYYKKSNIQLPLNTSHVPNKKIIRALKKLHLHGQSNPIRVIENFGSGSFDSEYIYSIYTADDQDDLERDLLQKLLKKIPDEKRALLITKHTEAGIGGGEIIDTTDEKSIKKHGSTETSPTKKLSLIEDKPVTPELVAACKKKTRKDGGLYTFAFRNRLIEYIKKLYQDNPEKVLTEIKRLEKIKHRQGLEKYCVEIDIL